MARTGGAVPLRGEGSQATPGDHLAHGGDQGGCGRPQTSGEFICHDILTQPLTHLSLPHLSSLFTCCYKNISPASLPVVKGDQNVSHISISPLTLPLQSLMGLRRFCFHSLQSIYLSVNFVLAVLDHFLPRHTGSSWPKAPFSFCSIIYTS